MKLILVLFIFLLFNNCSLNKDSQFWTEEVGKKNFNQKKLLKILEKKDDIINLNHDEYEIYIDDYTKINKYPNISE